MWAAAAGDTGRVHGGLGEGKADNHGPARPRARGTPPATGASVGQQHWTRGVPINNPSPSLKSGVGLPNDPFFQNISSRERKNTGKFCFHARHFLFFTKISPMLTQLAPKLAKTSPKRLKLVQIERMVGNGESNPKLMHNAHNPLVSKTSTSAAGQDLL